MEQIDGGRPIDQPDRDIVSIENLQLPRGVIAPDVWGKDKEQPALLSIRIQMADPGFSSAASQDKVNASTIHYGELSKRIRKGCADHADTNAGLKWQDVGFTVQSTLSDMGRKAEGAFSVANAVVELNLPKASMYSESGISLLTVTDYDATGKATVSQRAFVLNNSRCMVLVGVNAYERQARQPVEASLTCFLLSPNKGADSSSDAAFDMESLFAIDRLLAEFLQDTFFETLEALAEATMQSLQEHLLIRKAPGSHVRLRLKKPRAIAFADAPSVEVWRKTPTTGS
ncbi:hypothetical protein BAUCODRAFT_64347 [Baudoinia panamericana UAMH 10762]|uniref:Dihydroneopterin aldolase/epimerase domain-containing protein n=1 Tax=Baudoinia panamericana (strain UAMH 10762) TaxID=717646 RepID=M2MSG2_BAUPA|nr:uncharacterized protein BAUCODRAFT_64347 [Baudoinia panamericana UAMH 10762]EMC99811.1 hypothetical protein BAUCODRAFT_64347 [Baudoinia panamericana UAMH 10762]